MAASARILGPNINAMNRSGDRAVTERLEGIPTERQLDEHAAVNMPRDTARRSNRKLTRVTEAAAGSRALLPGRPIARENPT